MLEATETLTGWYDAGVKDGLNHLLPSISFRLHNKGDAPVRQIQLTVSFWRDGDDGEWESKEVRGLGSEALAPGALSEPILVRSDIGYTLEQPRAELFSHSQFRDASVKLFAKRGGKIAPLGEFKIDRRIIPHVGPMSSAP
jgi:hypothetical protein